MFSLGKIAGFLAYPSALIFLALVIGLIASAMPETMRASRRAGRALLLAATVSFGVLGFTDLWAVVMSPLETRFPKIGPDAPPPVGIVLIGGMIDGATRPATGQDKMVSGAEALGLTIDLARRWPTVPIVLSGTGSIEEDGTDFSEAATMARTLEAAGISPDRFILERRSRTTWENAAFSRQSVEPKPGARWLLVTPSWHMPRSIGAFRAAGWDGIVAAPSIGEADRPLGVNAPPSERLRLFDAAVREWMGLIAYRLLGRSPTLFPAP